MIFGSLDLTRSGVSTARLVVMKYGETARCSLVWSTDEPSGHDGHAVIDVAQLFVEAE